MRDFPGSSPLDSTRIITDDLCADRTVAVTPSLITIPAPMLPVVAGSFPSTLRKYPEMWPGQNAVTRGGVIAVLYLSYLVGCQTLLGVALAEYPSRGHTPSFLFMPDKIACQIRSAISSFVPETGLPFLSEPVTTR